MKRAMPGGAREVEDGRSFPGKRVQVMVFAHPPHWRWLTGVTVLVLALASREARAQDFGGGELLGALHLLARAPERGAADVPGGARGDEVSEVAARVLATPPREPVALASASEPSVDAPVAASAPVAQDVPRVGDGGRVSPPDVGLLSAEPRPPFRVAPAVVAVVPGLLFHGLGSWVAGDGTTARRLFALEGTGLGLIAVGGVPIVLTGASRRTIGPLYAVTLAGVSLFSISALANLYAVASPAFDPGVVPATLPPLEFDLGYQYVSDPVFEYRHFVALGAVARLSSVRLEAAARLSPDEGNTRVRAGGAYRLLGRPDRALGGGDGSWLDAEAFALYHRYPTEGFTVGGGEVGLRGRYAMARLSPRLAGSFAEASLGASFQGYSYPGPVSDDNLHEQLLFTFGYGVWLGRGGPLRGEAMLYYDHRKDDLAGGMRTLGGGVVGSFGLRGRALLTNNWGVSAEVQAGGALLGRLSLVYALGGGE